MPLTSQNRPAPTSADAASVLARAAYLTLFSGPNYQIPETDYFLIPFLHNTALVYESINHELGRRMDVELASLTPQGGFRIRRTIGSRVINSSRFKMTGVPNNFQPNFHSRRGLDPPPSTFGPLSRKTILIPEYYRFLDRWGSELDTDGVARFYPASTTRLYIAGVGNLKVGKGQLQGAVGTLTVSGYTHDPPFFSNHFTFRLVQPAGKLISGSPLPPVEGNFPDPDPDSVLLPLMAELHPDYPVVIGPAAESGEQRVQWVERLRWAKTASDVGPGHIMTYTAAGEVVGERRTTLVFNPGNPDPVIPLYSLNSVFTFFAGGRQIGTLQAEISEGRAIRTWAEELAEPYFRIGGYGQLGQGTGQFSGLTGLITVNGALSLAPPAVSSMYLLRIADPQYRFRPLWP